MSEEDRSRWDARYAEQGPAPTEAPAPLPVFASLEHCLPHSGRALEVACGRGRGALWLAHRGLHVHGVDVSPIAVELARELVERAGVAGRCRLEVFDLDRGLPEGPPVDLLLCHLFRDSRLDALMMQRLGPGGVLAVAVRSEVDVGPGRYRAAPGELLRAFASLECLAQGEAAGVAWLIGRRPPGSA